MQGGKSKISNETNSQVTHYFKGLINIRTRKITG